MRLWVAYHRLSSPLTRTLCAGVTGSQLHTVGLLVVEATVPGSPADGVLEPGDVLVRVQGQVVSHFLMLEGLLDAAVGQTIELQLERGGKPLAVQLPVTDLHSVTPSSMLELAGGSVHALSYQQARNNRAVVGQVYVAEVRASKLLFLGVLSASISVCLGLWQVCVCVYDKPASRVFCLCAWWAAVHE